MENATATIERQSRDYRELYDQCRAVQTESEQLKSMYRHEIGRFETTVQQRDEVRVLPQISYTNRFFTNSLKGDKSHTKSER